MAGAIRLPRLVSTSDLDTYWQETRLTNNREAYTGNADAVAKMTMSFQLVKGENRQNSHHKVHCPECHAPTDIRALDAHIQDRHPAHYPYHNTSVKRCPVCPGGKTFARHDALLDHLSHAHDVDNFRRQTDYNYLKRKRYDHLLAHHERAAYVVNAHKQRVVNALLRRGRAIPAADGLSVDLTVMRLPTDPTTTAEYRNAVGAGTPTYDGKKGREASIFWLARKVVELRTEGNDVVQLENSLGL